MEASVGIRSAVGGSAGLLKAAKSGMGYNTSGLT